MPWDLKCPPPSQLAYIAGASHSSLTRRTSWSHYCKRRALTELVCCSASAVDRFGRSDDASPASLQQGVPAILSNVQALYQFSRPHTMLGTFISICSVSLLAMVSSTIPMSCPDPCMLFQFILRKRRHALHAQCHNI